MKLIGRESPADIRIPVAGVSGLHLLVECLCSGEFRIWDLGSTNGTFVKGERVSEAVVSPQDDVQLGSWKFDWTALVTQLHAAESPGSTLSIGRDRHNDIVIPDPRVSSRHAAAVVRGHQALLVDLNSSNGTFIDGGRISCSVLNPDSRVALGSMPVELTTLLAARGVMQQLPQKAPEAPSVGSAEPVQPSLTIEDSGADDPVAGRSMVRRPWLVWGGVAAAVAVAVLTALFFTGTIWPYWYRPYEDPWPAAVAAAGDSLRSHPGFEQKIEQVGASAAKAAEQLQFLEPAEDALRQIDSWRRQRANEELGMAISILGGVTGQQIPDNFYDLVLASLDYVAPGAGESLRSIEDFVRDALDARDGLQAIASGCPRMAREVTAFRSDESKSRLLQFEQETRRLQQQLEGARPELASLQSRAGSVITSAAAVRAAINGAAGTTMGSYVRPQLYQVQSFVARIIEPIELFEQELHDVVIGTPTVLGELDDVPAAVSRAKSSDELQRRRHARGGPS